MDKLLSRVRIKVNGNIFDKDPEGSELGKRIIKCSIKLIDSIGFEHFTFRKLSLEISTSEASIYRYFPNKHRLLLYLTSWYWAWMEYKLVFATTNIKNAEQKFKICIKLLTEEVQQDGDYEHINERILHKIVVAESSKAYLVKEVDRENEFGAFKPYKNIVQRVSDIISEINPSFKYPHMLVSTIIEGVHHQRYFAAHLPRLTDIHSGEDSIMEFYYDMAVKTIDIE